jgi:hypothetical protein
MKFVVAFCLMILCSFMSVPSTTNVPTASTTCGSYGFQVNSNVTGNPVFGPVTTVWYEFYYGDPEEGSATFWYFDENGLWTSYTFTTWNHNWVTWQNGDGEMQ